MNDNFDLPHLVRVCEAATPGEWTAFILANGNGGEATPDFVAEYVKATILKSEQESGTTEFMFVSCEKPDGRADICHVGNGPTSKQNARFIATFQPSTVLALLRRLMEAEEFILQERHKLGSGSMEMTEFDTRAKALGLSPWKWLPSPLIYQIPDGTWARSHMGIITDGFATKEHAERNGS